MCERVSGHPGVCMARCQEAPGCTEPMGHRGRCTSGTYRRIAWAVQQDRCEYPVGTFERPTITQSGGQQ